MRPQAVLPLLVGHSNVVFAYRVVSATIWAALHHFRESVNAAEAEVDGRAKLIVFSEIPVTLLG